MRLLEAKDDKGTKKTNKTKCTQRKEFEKKQHDDIVKKIIATHLQWKTIC